MSTSVDLNADMGEGVGDDAALLQLVSSANIACGAHAGDAQTMARSMTLARQNGVVIGAHPGFEDRKNFGRTRISLSAQEFEKLVISQVELAQEVAASVGTRIRHLKLHGALANMAGESAEISRSCFKAALTVAPELRITAMAATQQVSVAQALGADYACEIFADRAYNPDGSLRDRSLPGAVLHDPEQAAQRILAMLEQGAIIASDGSKIPTQIDTICVHGDSPQALAMAKGLRQHLTAAGVRISAP